jgi:peptide deformylase
MSILSIFTAPSPILQKKSMPIGSVDAGIKKFMHNMLETMYEDKGVGLAAVQVGILQRILVADLQDDEDIETPQGLYPLFMANPEIINKSDELILATEGCLSLPEQKVEMARSSAITVKFLNYSNQTQELNLDGWIARVIQHEIDHLDGRLLVDYLSNIKRNVAMRKLQKLKKLKNSSL